jgi:AraC family transcriptional activator of pobA
MAIDKKDIQLTAGQVITITSGQIHTINKSLPSKGFILEFTLDFFCKDDKDIELIFHKGLFCHFGMNKVIDAYKSVVEPLLLLIQEELEEQPYPYLLSVHSRIELLLVAINRAKVKFGGEIWKPDALFLKFLEAVRGNFEHNYTVAQLAHQ